MKVEHQTRQHMQIAVTSSHIDFNAVDTNSVTLHASNFCWFIAKPATTSNSIPKVEVNKKLSL